MPRGAHRDNLVGIGSGCSERRAVGSVSSVAAFLSWGVSLFSAGPARADDFVWPTCSPPRCRPMGSAASTQWMRIPPSTRRMRHAPASVMIEATDQPAGGGVGVPEWVGLTCNYAGPHRDGYSYRWRGGWGPPVRAAEAAPLTADGYCCCRCRAGTGQPVSGGGRASRGVVRYRRRPEAPPRAGRVGNGARQCSSTGENRGGGKIFDEHENVRCALPDHQPHHRPQTG